MNRYIRIIAVVTVSLATSATVAVAQDTPTANTPMATVDGVDITLGHVVALRGRLPAEYQDLPNDVLMKAIVDQLIQQTVLMNAITRNLDDRSALALENEKRAFLASEMMTRISERDITAEELQTAYAERYESEIPDQEFNASHILVATEEEAIELVKILQDGADFATLAKERSTGPSGPSGGELGWFGKGRMVPEFETAVLRMAVDEISPPVQTQFGWHVIRLNDMRTPDVPTLEQVRPRLVVELQQQAVEAEIARLTETAEVSRFDDTIDPDLIRDISIFSE